ncbi:hypothetical protein HAPAU_35870 [Halalkalicoccus paucihalophilus]|uniref:Uncharacterized protein n=1 Tax=Halalkalicoccus paucihalophilus TaxID=1008153 RepID=A0A151AAH9_9EURY|nr:hypothetical protein [Halalkalicoccus paucihalophilus]KYH24604.1 hypothetical protein HAPAU_35870 [Halalkalicoccus paucihalophilus]
MDDFETVAETVTTEEAFTTVLQKLVQPAHENEGDIEGRWECRTTTDDSDWEIMILELAKKDAGR